MRNLYNKALMYQAFQKTKWILMVCSFILLISYYFILRSNFNLANANISNLNTNVFSHVDATAIMLVCCFIFLVYIVVIGNNKKEYRNFLGSAPFSKEDIKKNEITFLFIALTIAVVIFVYISICFYFRNEYLISISYGYFISIFEDTIRIFIIGSMFIAYLLLIELLFSNITFFSLMLILTPIVFLFNLAILERIKEYMNTVSFISGTFKVNMDKCILAIYNYIFRTISYLNFNIKYEVVAIAILVFLTIVGFIVMWQINKRMNCNRANKLFTFPFVENVFSYVFSFSIINFIVYIIIDSALGRMYVYNRERIPSIINNIYFYVIVIFTITFSFALMKPVKKIVNKFV
ncbi:MAG: hypothetical protein E7214_03440 [Clostridium sp.]|nr:hypothetical protein [Clostridium sp.]